MEIQHVQLRITGLVQGVFYRKTAAEQARSLGIRGYVMNLPDGSVLVEAEGPAPALEQFITWSRQGPLRARVLDVLIVKGPVVGYPGFEVRR